MRKILLPITMFVIASLFYFYEFLLRVTPGAIFGSLMEDFQIDATQLGLLSSFYFLSYAVLQLPVGAWMDRFGPRRLLTFAIILCASSTILFGITESFFFACLARLLIGAGSAFAFISCIKIVTLWFKPERFAILAGLTLTIGTLGAVFGEIPVALALRWVSWRDLMLWIGIGGLGLALLSWIFIRDQNSAAKTIEQIDLEHPPLGFWTCLKTVTGRAQNWWIAAYAFLVTGPTDAFGGMWGIPYLVHAHGFKQAAAATASSMTFVGLACGSPFLGWLSARWESRRRPMAFGASLAILATGLLVYLPNITFPIAATLFFMFGFFGGYVLSFVAARDINEPQYVGTMVGFVNMASMVGSMVLMYGIGRLLDRMHHTGGAIVPYTIADYHVSLAVIPLCYVICVFVVIFKIRETYPKN